MYLVQGACRTRRLTTAEATVLATALYTAGAGANLFAFVANKTAADATSIRVYAGLTATATGTAIAGTTVYEQGVALAGLMVLSSSPATARTLPFPAYASGGAVIVIAGGAADVTLYWNPA